MNLIGIIRGIVRSTRRSANVTRVQADPGAGNNLSADIYGPSGDDSQPLPGDYVAMLRLPGQNRFVSVGVIDPMNTDQSLPGEKRLYSRDGDGVIVASLWLKNDGSVLLTNDNGSLELQSSGDIIANTVTIDTSGNITTSGTITGGQVQTSAGKDLDAHTHGGVEPGNGSTGPAQ